jgi:hypothetical protein
LFQGWGAMQMFVLVQFRGAAQPSPLVYMHRLG